MAENIAKTLLLVEDESIIALSSKLDLEQYGYAVRIVSSGEEAIEVVKTSTDINLILMDIDLGAGIDGTEAAEIILQDKDIPIVFLSSHIEPYVVEKTENISTYGYVVKNSSITVLDASIKMAFKLFNSKTRAKQMSEQFRAIVENTTDYIMRYNEKGQHIYSNPSALKAYGLTLEQYIVKSYRDMGFSNKQCLVLEKTIKDVFETGNPQLLEIEVELANKQMILQMQFSPEFSSNGNVKSIIGVSRDISALKQIEENLRTHQIELHMQNEELQSKNAEIEALRLHSLELYDIAPAGDISLNKNGLIIETNLTAADLFKFSADKLVSKPFDSLIKKEDQDKFYIHRKQLFQTDVTQYCVLRLIKSDKSEFTALIKAVKNKDKNGDPICRTALMEIDKFDFIKKKSQDPI